MTACRIALVVAAVAMAAVSSGYSLRQSWAYLIAQRTSYGSLTSTDPNLVPGFQSLLPRSVADFFRARMSRGERFYVQVPQGPFMPGVDYPTAVRTFARFELLPAIAVADPHEADVVLSVGVDPRRLGLRYRRIERADPRYAVARVDR